MAWRFSGSRSSTALPRRSRWPCSIGAGTGLFNPASLAAVPSLVKPERLPAATALYGAITDLGYIVGPALAALLLLFGGPELILYGNAATFALSAVVLTQLRFGAAPPVEDASTPRPGLLREAREGLATIAGMVGHPRGDRCLGRHAAVRRTVQRRRAAVRHRRARRGQRRLRGADRDLRTRLRRGVVVRLARRGCGRAETSLPRRSRTRRRRVHRLRARACVCGRRCPPSPWPASATD